MIQRDRRILNYVDRVNHWIFHEHHLHPEHETAQPGLGDTGWSTPLNNNCTTLDGLVPVGGLCVTLHEVPSATLTVAVSAGNYVQQDGTVGTYAGTGSQAITASTTKVLYLDLTASVR